MGEQKDVYLFIFYLHCLVCRDVVSSYLPIDMPTYIYMLNMWSSLSLTCDRSVVFSEYSSFFTNKTDRHDIAKILLKVVLNTINQAAN